MFRQHRIWIVVAIVVGTVLGSGLGTTSVALASDDIGYRDFSFSATEVSGPAGEKPQSKLWFNDGIWWGSLFNSSTEEYRIYRYDQATHTWSDTGTLVDERNSSKADTLWDGTHLYIVSAGPRSSLSSNSARVLRYSYDAATKSYSLDEGFPVTITNSGMEAIVLAKDTTGELWATYTQGSKVYVNHTLGDDLTWATPSVLPVQGTSVSSDDISSVIAFDSQIGVMWSNELDSTTYFATHKDGDPADTWQAGTALQGTSMSDDHINLKADSSGRVFAAVKTSLDDVPNQDPEAPLNLLLVRDRDGNWTNHVFGTVRNNHTRPIVLIDEEHRNLFMFASATCCSGERGIYYKRSSLDNISFPEGRGEPFIQSATDPGVFDATSTKQNLDGDTGLTVLASDNASGYYLHNDIDLNSIDTTPPSVRPPGQGLVANSTLDTTKVPIQLSWSGTDDASGVSQYKLQQSTNGGSYTDVWLETATTTSRLRPLEPGNTYRFRVRAEDVAGNWSDWTYGPEFTMDAYQETSDAIAYNGYWTQEDSTNAYGGARKYAKGTSGETAKFTFTGNQVAWVATKNYNRGMADVYLDGVKMATVDLYSASGLARRVVFNKSRLTSGTHTLEVRALGTKNAASSGTRVDVDAFVVLS